MDIQDGTSSENGHGESTEARAAGTVLGAQGGAGSRLAIFRIFLALGCSSFGGPAAHLGYFRREFVDRRRWISESTLAELIAIAQMLPGPGSSQTCFLIGVLRGGIGGGVAAWAGFTLPSAVLMVLFAMGVERAHGAFVNGFLHGLQIAAVAVVAAAVAAMFRRLCPDFLRAFLAALTMAVVLVAAAPLVQIGLLALCGAVAWGMLRVPEERDDAAFPLKVSRATGVTCALVVAGLFGVLGALAPKYGLGRLAFAFYRTGALVFGGGHVVLPLLESAVVRPGWVSQRIFLAGYGAAQTVPGPLFTFGAFLGFVARPGADATAAGFAGAAIGLFAIFLPGILLALAAASVWGWMRQWRSAQRVIAGVNASVVGLLGAALIHAARNSFMGSVGDVLLALGALAALTITRVPPVIVVIVAAAGEGIVNAAKGA